MRRQWPDFCNTESVCQRYRIASACCSAFALSASAQDADKKISDAVIASVKAQWASDIKSPANIADQSKDQADDYTELNARYATRVDGKEMNMRLAEGSETEEEGASNTSLGAVVAYRTSSFKDWFAKIDNNASNGVSYTNNLYSVVPAGLAIGATVAVLVAAGAVVAVRIVVVVRATPVRMLNFLERPRVPKSGSRPRCSIPRSKSTTATSPS